jgi:hypothetical protein
MDQDQSAPGELAANASDGEKDAIALLLNEGYELRFLSPELAYEDFANLPPATTPTGFEIRPLEAQDHRAVAQALIEANADPNLTPEQLAAWTQREEAGWTQFVADCDPATWPGCTCAAGTVAWAMWQTSRCDLPTENAGWHAP